MEEYSEHFENIIFFRYNVRFWICRHVVCLDWQSVFHRNIMCVYNLSAYHVYLKWLNSHRR
jgi:hypothetical protein